VTTSVPRYAGSKFMYFIVDYQKAVTLIDKILTFIKVTLATGTNFPAVSLNSLLAEAMKKTRQR
jgi:hypothetical protein